MYNLSIQNYLQKHSCQNINLKAVLIDMDGVLYDSMRNHAQAWYLTMTEQGIKCSPEEFYLYEGRTGASTINLLFNREFGHGVTDEEVHRIYRLKTDFFNRMPKAKPMPGAAGFLDNIRKKGLIPVLVTGSGQSSLIDKLNHSYPGAFMPKYMVTAFDVKYGKPDPEPYLMGLKKAEVEPNQAIVIENAPLGVQAGVAAGIFTIGVNTGPLDDKVLIDAGADLLLSSMQQLSESFDDIYYQLENTSF